MTAVLRVSKTPSCARKLWAAALLALAWPQAAAAQSALGEREVMALARSQSPAGAASRATEELTSARVDQAGLPANPQLHWSREAIATSPTASEDVVSIRFPFELGRREAARALVASEGAWLQAEATLEGDDAVLRALLVYYDAALAAEHVRVLARALGDMEEAGRVLASREVAGSASGYETTRLSIASELAESALAEARGQLASTRARLAVLLGRSAESLVLAPLSLPTTSPEAQTTPPAQLLEHSRSSTALAAQAVAGSDSLWIPRFELEGGFKRVSDLGGGVGYVVGISVDIPLFDRGQTLAAEAEAQHRLAATRSGALSQAFEAERASARVAYAAAKEEFQRFETRTAGALETLLVAATSGYREGARSIVELLDAQQAQTAVAERRLMLLHNAKRAEAQLRRASGELR